MADEETFEGYVVDIACLRKYPQNALLSKARRHTLDCALMGHCVESGYGVVGDDGVARYLDSGATPKVLDVLKATRASSGIRLRVGRAFRDGQMHTDRVDELAPLP